jgi:hypothetical protein
VFILILELFDFILQSVDEILLSLLKVLMFLSLNSHFSLILGLSLLQLDLKILEALSLLLILGIDISLLRLFPGHSIIENTKRFLFLGLNALFIGLLGLSLLLIVFLDSLLLELDLLVFESLISLKVNLGLSQIINSLLVFLLQVFNFFSQR